MDRITNSYKGYFDGACPINPYGNMGIGGYINSSYDETIFVFSKFISIKEVPNSSCNVAEYMAMIELLNYFIKNDLQNETITIYGDSQLVIYQMEKIYRCGKRGIYKPYYLQAFELVKKFSDIHFKWIPREQNIIADELSKEKLTENTTLND